MGIKNLHTLLRKLCPQVYNRVPLTKYAFKKIAIDLSIFMCKYRTSFGMNWLDAFLQMIAVLRYNEIHFVIVYDSKAPPEKDDERKSRSDARAKSRERVDRIQESWDTFKTEHDKQIMYQDDVKNDEVLYHFISKLMESQGEISLIKVDNEILKMRHSLLSIRSEDFDLTRELFTICGIPFLLAHGEAEATCAALNRQGYVSAVMTDDTDVLAYGTPIMLSKLDFQTNTCIEIDYQEVLLELKLQSEEFLDLCIMCGTDYNKNMSKVGPDKSYKLIQQYKRIEDIQKYYPSLNYETLNYARVRQLFTQELEFHSDIPFCDFPNRSKLIEFCFQHNTKYDVNHVLRCCYHSQFHEFDIDDDQHRGEEKEKKINLLLTNK